MKRAPGRTRHALPARQVTVALTVNALLTAQAGITDDVAAKLLNVVLATGAVALSARVTQ